MADPRLERLKFSDGYDAALRWWLPDAPRGAVLYLHGIQSHGGWYEGSGRYLADRGFAVMMPDRRGSGLNQVARGHAESADRLLEDGRELIDALTARTGCRRVHVVGVSWGGKWAVTMAMHDGDRIASLSLVAPGLFPKVDLPIGERLRVGWALLADPNRPCRLPLNDPHMFTSNPKRIAEVERDPLRLLDATASFLYASRRLDRLARAFQQCGWRGGLHVMLAGNERIIDNERTRTFLREPAAMRTRLTEYPDASHTIEFEPDPTAFYADLACGIEECTD